MPTVFLQRTKYISVLLVMVVSKLDGENPFISFEWTVLCSSREERKCTLMPLSAFLAMDLDFRGKKTLSSYFVNRYIEKSGDTDLATLLGFYMCYRAYVRGKVTGFRLDDPNISNEEKEKARSVAKRYFEYAYQYSKEF